MESANVKNIRIAKNTALLYIRTLFTLIVSLYTSRVVLQALGVDNYGVYNVVGGFVAMFSIVTSPISGAISRFLTFGLGTGDIDKLRATFATSINILLCLGLIVVLLGETVGIWFLNNKLNIPAESMVAAHWVLQCSIIATLLGLMNIPFSAAIIAHEKMNVFAFISILDALLKLGLAFSLTFLPFNTLITYSVGIIGISVINVTFYSGYCHRKFSECRYKMRLEKGIFKEMTGFAWWTFFGNTSYIFNTQGVSMLMNIFFGVVVNTAKGIAMQVEGAVMSFINSFTLAFSPQITKSYAEGNRDYMISVMCRGTKFSIYLMLLFLIPLEFEAPLVLRLWLGEVPEYSPLFLRLSLICTTVMMLGMPFLQGITATGKIRDYQISVTAIGCLVFPITWILYKKGYGPQVFYWVYFTIYNLLIWVRMWFVRKLLGFKIKMFVTEIFMPIVVCTILSLILPSALFLIMPDTISRLIVLILVSTISTACIVLLLGVTRSERSFILAKIPVIRNINKR